MKYCLIGASLYLEKNKMGYAVGLQTRNIIKRENLFTL